eukprot:CAMPEP_0113919224 /NCGR_PEP_ID=MMETSP0780_2-20120614/33795_1 /TAXON_ID=652834 /ORGANISM="Palpitomonas bilix" /LENGTH=540 /DNA_ID=CAMNT_0000919133 /DNA_START=995 /DNA_END=2617 /DNA_ORIENTATION=- /assembly_acc=CAM_ASM_000599
MWEILKLRKLTNRFLAESFVQLLHAPPLVSFYFTPCIPYMLHNKWKQGVYVCTRGHIIGVVVLFRLYLLFSVLSDSRFKKTAARFLASITRIKSNWYLSIRLSIDEHPIRAVGIMFLSILSMSSVLLFVVEGDLGSGVDSELSSYSNCLWLTFVTMTTVGYGDFAPQTEVGRLILGLTMLVSSLANALMVAVFFRLLQLSQHEQNYADLLVRAAKRENATAAAANLIRRRWLHSIGHLRSRWRMRLALQEWSEARRAAEEGKEDEDGSDNEKESRKVRGAGNGGNHDEQGVAAENSKPMLASVSKGASSSLQMPGSDYGSGAHASGGAGVSKVHASSRHLGVNPRHLRASSSKAMQSPSGQSFQALPEPVQKDSASVSRGKASPLPAFGLVQQPSSVLGRMAEERPEGASHPSASIASAVEGRDGEGKLFAGTLFLNGGSGQKMDRGEKGDNRALLDVVYQLSLVETRMDALDTQLSTFFQLQKEREDKMAEMMIEMRRKIDERGVDISSLLLLTEVGQDKEKAEKFEKEKERSERGEVQ